MARNMSPTKPVGVQLSRPMRPPGRQMLHADFVGRVPLDLRFRSAGVDRHPAGGRPRDDVARLLLAVDRARELGVLPARPTIVRPARPVV